MKSTSIIQIAIIFAFLLPTGLFAQQNTFTSVFYDPTNYNSVQGHSVTRTYDSNYLIVGEYNNQALGLKMDQNGQILWEKTYDFGWYSAILTRIIPTHDSCFMIAGTLGPQYSASDIVCMKINADGDTLWAKSYDLGSDETVSFIQQTGDHGYILSGYTGYYSPNDQQMFVVKLDSAGEVGWSTLLSAGLFLNCAHSVKELPDSGYIVAGHFGNINYWDHTAILIKLSPAGSVIWAKEVEIPEANRSSVFDVLVEDSTLLSYIDAPYEGTVLLKTDLSGTIQWSKKYPPHEDWTMSLAEKSKLHPTPGYGYIFVTPGQFGAFLKLDSVGEVEWAQWMFLENVDVIPVTDGGFLVLGNGPLMGVEMAPTFNPQIGMIKTDSLGNSDDCIEWAWIQADTCTLSLLPLQVDTDTGATSGTLHPEIYETSLLIFNGCVAMTGGVDDGQQEYRQLVISPNPSGGHVQIKLETEGESLSTFDIYNSTGQRVYHSDARVNLPAEIDFSFFPDGIYFISATSDGKRYSKKLIISR